MFDPGVIAPGAGPLIYSERR